MTTLLEQAQKIGRPYKHRNREYSVEDLQLVEAWLKDEIGATQMCKVRGLNTLTGNYLYYCASVLKYYYKRDKVKIKYVISEKI